MGAPAAYSQPDLSVIAKKRAWKIVNIFPFSFMAHVVYFRKPRKKFRMWF